jgi:hypothetical protein
MTSSWQTLPIVPGAFLFRIPGLINISRFLNRYYHRGKSVLFSPPRLIEVCMGFPTANTPAEPDHAATRVLVAAVVSQQAALDEREAALRERELAVAQQECQLAERLDDKQRQLDHLHEQLGVAREQFRHDRAVQQRLLEEAARSRAEAVAARDRLFELRGKFQRHWKRHWAAERKRWEQRQAEVERTRRTIEGEAAEARQDRDWARQVRQRLSEETRKLAKERECSRHDSRRKENELQALRQQVELGARKIAEAGRRLLSEQLRLQQECDSLRAEARGLENRICTARRLFVQQELARKSEAPARAGTGREVSLPPLPESVESALAEREERYLDRRTELEHQAAALADQRTHLAEMFQRMAGAEADWQAKQLDAVAEMELLASGLEKREQAMGDREREMIADSEHLRQERERIVQMRRESDRCAAEMTVRITIQRGEWQRLRAELFEREQLAQRREQALGDLFRRWRERRKSEVNRFRELVAAAVKARQLLVERNEECHRHAASMREAQQALAEQTLALEEARREFLAETDRPGAAARRIERLRRRWQRQSARARRELDRQCEALTVEDSELSRIYRELQSDQVSLVEKERELAQLRATTENDGRLAGDVCRQLEAARAAWLEQRRGYESQIADLQAHLERVVNLDRLPDRAAA